MLKILVVEDDLALNGLIAACLEEKGYAVRRCFDGESGYAAFSEGGFALIISDVMMPKMDGFALADKIRQTDVSVPIIFTTARDDKPSKVYGYRLGVDDYITKPFDVDDLILKVSAFLRRAKINNEKMISVGNLIMNDEERTALIDGEEISLTQREFDILFKLLSYPKKTFTRSALMNEFWDYDSSATSRTVDVYMAKIREKTQACNGFEILTVHGLGYKAVIKQ